MNEFIYTLIIVFIVVMLSFVLFNVKFIAKGEEFRKTCSTTGEKCSCSGDDDDEECHNAE
ncbi:MAG TPA: hypothetical protein ENI82_03285 [Bacteroidetes bacterium]|nr:hypothetical protein [Bacteroidota bacterium]